METTTENQNPGMLGYKEWLESGGYHPPLESPAEAGKKVTVETPTLNGIEKVSGETLWIDDYKGPVLVLCSKKTKGVTHHDVRLLNGGSFLEGSSGVIPKDIVIANAKTRVTNLAKSLKCHYLPSPIGPKSCSTPLGKIRSPTKT